MTKVFLFFISVLAFKYGPNGCRSKFEKLSDLLAAVRNQAAKGNEKALDQKWDNFIQNNFIENLSFNPFGP